MIARGVLYIISGTEDTLQECAHSARTLKKHSPSIPTQVIVKWPSALLSPETFDFIDVMPSGLHPLKAMVKHLLESRFDRTLFLDADTEIRGPIDHLFDRLNTHHIAFAHDNLCDWSTDPVRFLAQQSEDINTGLLLYDRSQKVRNYLKEWFEIFREQDEAELRPGKNCDQVYFNRFLRDRVMHDTDLQVQILPNHVYNVRPWCWKQLREQKQFDNALILHAHHLHHRINNKVFRKIRALLKLAGMPGFQTRPERT